jgi:hypothetical protein
MNHEKNWIHYMEVESVFVNNPYSVYRNYTDLVWSYIGILRFPLSNVEPYQLGLLLH